MPDIHDPMAGKNNHIQPNDILAHPAKQNRYSQPPAQGGVDSTALSALHIASFRSEFNSGKVAALIGVILLLLIISGSSVYHFLPALQRDRCNINQIIPSTSTPRHFVLNRIITPHPILSYKRRIYSSRMQINTACFTNRSLFYPDQRAQGYRDTDSSSMNHHNQHTQPSSASIVQENKLLQPMDQHLNSWGFSQKGYQSGAAELTGHVEGLPELYSQYKELKRVMDRELDRAIEMQNTAAKLFSNISKMRKSLDPNNPRQLENYYVELDKYKRLECLMRAKLNIYNQQTQRLNYISTRIRMLSGQTRSMNNP